jgi:hypothetical protein
MGCHAARAAGSPTAAGGTGPSWPRRLRFDASHASGAASLAGKAAPRFSLGAGRGGGGPGRLGALTGAGGGRLGETGRHSVEHLLEALPGVQSGGSLGGRLVDGDDASERFTAATVAHSAAVRACLNVSCSPSQRARIERSETGRVLCRRGRPAGLHPSTTRPPSCCIMPVPDCPALPPQALHPAPTLKDGCCR